MVELANDQGFAVESYQVTTNDGYILGLYRIPGRIGEQNGSAKPPVLMMHGLGSCMMSWFFNAPSVAPGFVMARKGYDVWLGNNRGNHFSDRHTYLRTDRKEYWDFDWEQMGTHDLPALIDFILDKTGYSQISYIGHSEGTT